MRDCAVKRGVANETDPRDPFALPSAATDYLAGIEDGVSGRRIAVSPMLGFPACDRAIASAFTSACADLEDLGAVLEEVELDRSWFCDAMDVIWRAAFAETILALPAEELSLVEPVLLKTAISVSAISAHALQLAFRDCLRLIGLGV